MFSALRNIAFAPFALAVEKWRWNAYSGNSTPETYNIDWWRLRCKYQGLVPPVPRADDDFDPGSKYVNNNYLSHFLVVAIARFKFVSLKSI